MTMTAVEYRVATFSDICPNITTLQEYGGDGWILAAIIPMQGRSRAIFYRHRAERASLGTAPKRNIAVTKAKMVIA